MRHLVSSALCALLSAACLAQTVPLRWAAELGDVRPARFTLVRGDTVELAADLFAEGRPYLPATADAALLWQTNGMGALWWEIPAAVASNRVSATWTPAMDCGAASYLAHFRVGSSTGSAFRAYARLAMQHGPGDPVNALPLPVPVLDFAKVVVTNAPWGEGGGTDGEAVTNIVKGVVGAGGIIITGKVTFAGSEWPHDDAITIEGGRRIRTHSGSLEIDNGSVEDLNSISVHRFDFSLDSWDMYYGGRQTLPDYIDEKTASYAKSADLGTAAYRDASEFATAADEALVYQLLTNRLSGVTFDFATVAGLYLAISNIVAAQGGAITNFPAIQ